MARTLKERYEIQRITLVQERAQIANRQLLREHRAAQLLVEAMNDQDLNKVSAIVQKLNSIKVPELPKLSAAIEQAQAEINKYTAGGPIAAAWTKMKKLVGIDNPIVKVATFADALEKGFSQIPVILKNNGVDLKNVDLSKSLATVLAASKTNGAGSSGQRADDSVLGSKSNGADQHETQNEADNDVAIQGKLKNIVAQLQKALSPGGIFGVFKKVPYISSQELAQELIQAPIRVFSTVAKRINSGAKAAEIAPDLKASVDGQGNVETKGSAFADPTKQASQTQPPQPATDPTASTNSVPTGQSTPQPSGGGAQQNFAAAKTKVQDILKQNRGNIDTLVKKLMDAGLDYNKL
jgi:hypothetical protein